MKILGIECSATAASVAVTDDRKILSSGFINVKLTHSQTLMPMVKQVLDNALIPLDDIDVLAISAGPGSFTGIRIGISAVKGLAAPKDTPCRSVSTLLCMAQLFTDKNAIICGCMDARCNQLYNALFEIKNGQIKRLCEDRAIMCDELEKEIRCLKKNSNLPIIITGDGADIFYRYVEDAAVLAPNHLKMQNAVGVCLAAENEEIVSADRLLPVYLRLPQAERELKQKKENKK